MTPTLCLGDRVKVALWGDTVHGVVVGLSGREMVNVRLENGRVITAYRDQVEVKPGCGRFPC